MIQVWRAPLTVRDCRTSLVPINQPRVLRALVMRPRSVALSTTLRKRTVFGRYFDALFGC